MAMRAATMSSFQSPTTAGESDSFMRKLVILLLLVVNAVLGIVLWFQVDRDLPLLLSTVFADMTVGLVAGFGARTVFRKWNMVAHYMMAFLMTVLGLILVGSLTKNVLGVGPFSLESEAADQFRRLSFDSTLPDQLRTLQIDPLNLMDFSGLEASDAVHLAWSLFLTVLSLMAWRGSARQIEVEPLGYSQIEVEPRNAGLSLSPERSNGSGSRAFQPVTWFQSPAPSESPRPRIRSRNRSRTAVKKDAMSAKSARKSRSRRRPQLKLAVVEEHRCPYCLDLVSRNDARGIKECDVCHTLHHADCWAITGFCQVPHLNS